MLFIGCIVNKPKYCVIYNFFKMPVNQRRCGHCRATGHNRRNCPDIRVARTIEDNRDQHEFYVRILSNAQSGIAIWDMIHTVIPRHLRARVLFIYERERLRNVQMRQARIMPQPPRVSIDTVCKTDIVPDKCMVCMEDTVSAEFWVEFGCGHGCCIPCRKSMQRSPLHLNCPYCRQTITEHRVVRPDAFEIETFS